MTKRKSNDIRLMVVFSDLHSGSRRSLMMPEYTLFEEGKLEHTIKANKQQLWLYDCWKRGWDSVFKYIGKDKWCWAFNGDAIDGAHHRMTELVSNDPLDHQQIFMGLNEDIAAEADERIFVRGTECHTGLTTEMSLAKKLNCRRHPDNGQWAADRWMVEMNGFPFLLRHHMSVTAREWSRGTALSGELSGEIASAGLRNQPIPRGLCCAHRHGFDCWNPGSGFMLVTGPWQQTTRYGQTKWGSMIPGPSLSILDFRDTPHGGAPKIENFVYEPKAATVTKL